MKVTVEIPKGTYCGSCSFRIFKECAYLHGVHLGSGAQGILKHKDCPAKEET